VVAHRRRDHRIVTARPRNWVFLGDSLTEGIGSTRATYVHEFVQQLRAQAQRRHAIHEMRLRDVDPLTFNPYIRTNLAGHFEADDVTARDALWVWNLASEGRTIDMDPLWLPFLTNLQPEEIFIYRGSLESIVRPAGVTDGDWPWWVPQGWRGFVAMDPRCYFSTTPIRRIKQTSIDAMKQRVRLRLLASRAGQPLFAADAIVKHYEVLLGRLSTLQSRVHMLGLIAPGEEQFPGSAAHFAALNARLKEVARVASVEFIDWAADINAAAGATSWRYRDGFHPNAEGARVLARILSARVSSSVAV
jgi:lysophospholipase L1-like esterase